jgi:hypothetical protein
MWRGMWQRTSQQAVSWTIDPPPRPQRMGAATLHEEQLMSHRCSLLPCLPMIDVAVLSLYPEIPASWNSNAELVEAWFMWAAAVMQVDLLRLLRQRKNDARARALLQHMLEYTADFGMQVTPPPSVCHIFVHCRIWSIYVSHQCPCQLLWWLQMTLNYPTLQYTSKLSSMIASDNFPCSADSVRSP